MSYGVTVSVALLRTEPFQAEIVANIVRGTGLVRTVNVIDVSPAGTVTLAGTFAMIGLLLLKRTTTPPSGADPLSVMVPVDVLPPVTVVGLSVSDDNETVTLAVCTL